ncbi:TPA: alpha-N-arabinofuranosidase, partial [Candidatus Sumerlaeota bacterium]|nr:alpha-N-arabinofuranosidase [Candidatus Sumerlaeota bacterium]
RSNGLRADLAQMVADMKPKFIRFPGGCFVEGNTLENANRWKKTIGDVAERPGHWNLWGYWSNDGFGAYEFFQYCEDIQAEPLYVINCGMSHREQGFSRLPDAKSQYKVNVDEYLQDAMDFIEYANGPADSKWGALRAKAGHPAPFNLKYMEIGNENGGPIYNANYEKFRSAILAKYPKMRLVACDWTGSPDKKYLDILDEHYYDSPGFFFRSANKYDSYDRKGPKIYVGEYA